MGEDYRKVGKYTRKSMSGKMKILQVIPAFPPARGYGGGPYVAYEISRHLVKRGHEVTVCTTDADTKSDRIKKYQDIIDGINVYYFRNLSNFLAYNHKLFLTPSLISWARKKVKDFDVIHLHDTRTVQNLIVAHYARKYGIPYIIQPHGTLTSKTRYKILSKSIFDKLFGAKLFSSASMIIALNDEEKIDGEKRGVKSVVLPNGVNIEDFRTLPERGRFRRVYNISENTRIILYLGRLHECMGIELLIRAYGELAKIFYDSVLFIIGPDDGIKIDLIRLTTELKLGDRVKFIDYLSGEKKLSAFVDADVFVTPVFYGFPITFLESWACGTPVITTARGAVIEGLDKNLGLVARYDIADLKNSIAKLLTDKELRERMGKSGQKTVREEYNWANITPKLESLYKELRIDLAKS